MINVTDYRPENHEEFVLTSGISPCDGDIVIAELDFIPFAMIQYCKNESEIKISGIGVAKDFRRQGVASSIMDYLKLKFPKSEITASVRECDLSVVNFLLSCDFEIVQKVDGKYEFQFFNQQVPKLDITNRVSKYYG